MIFRTAWYQYHLNCPGTLHTFLGHFSEVFGITVTDGYEISSDAMPHYLSYFLADEIYPQWTLFASPIGFHGSNRAKKCVKQSSIRQEVEGFFGILQSCFEILCRKTRRWGLNFTIRIPNTSVILHNILTPIIQFVDGNNDIFTDMDITGILSTAKISMEQLATERLHNFKINKANRQNSLQEESAC